jgi:predicted hydrocarbon binding protein/KaiC/GvpD/RAD55 family RecA-like ATPase
MVSLAQLYEVPSNNLILLVGFPGSGKSSFCQQVVLQNLASDRPIIYVTTESSSSKSEKALIERGLGRIESGLLNFVDAYSETVGISLSDRPNTVPADCANLSSIGIAISKLQERIGKKGILMVFDSLVSPYLLAGPEVVRFMRLTLSRFVAEGNAVLACMDAGCGKPEDVGAMMSLANGVIKMRIEEDKQHFDIVKHPQVTPTTIEVPVMRPPRVISFHFDTDYLRRELEMFIHGFAAKLRPEVGDLINIAWRDLIFWSGMLWDPTRFPNMMYELTKYSEDISKVPSNILPFRVKLLFKFMPKNLSKVKDMKKLVNMLSRYRPEEHGMAILEYLEDASTTDEHYLRLHEHYECWGFENVGTSMGIMRPALFAGTIKGFEKLKGLDRDWNIIETKCIGLGDPYCEVKMVPGEIDELTAALEKEESVIQKIHEQLLDHLIGFMLHGKPLMERPTIGSGVHIHDVQHVTAAPTVNERLQTVFRMGGARAGKMLGEHLLESELKEQETVTRLIDLMEHCKVGKLTLGETIRMRENCERFGIKTEQPSCFFTTGFLNGFFSTIRNQHVRETRCIAMGDPYCEWEFR